METFQILHLAASWPTGSHPPPSQGTGPPVGDRPATPAISDTRVLATQNPPADVYAASKDGTLLAPPPRIRAAAAHIVFAARESSAFITPAEVEEIENWTGRSILEALARFYIAPEVTSRAHHQATTFADCLSFSVPASTRGLGECMGAVERHDRSVSRSRCPLVPL
ncbi:uncharacterized protein PHACADRAFT_246117 [Phanerochaete carnosa HHB-10118-sp]|uniref:Uncharacterized protein n=1 Tax=Phanerochaete carnosa (strain HHB-10118-sp) TaxID=650164 RepID=K5XBB7_PHACS|nr:uncharacterized protein PHACADRAFT_246117 [Phanerochaete carnosa HHB-10118-sp]EKM60252.1 hypothetical protein PHACADRAFT_246117 [Phanerochaete carnosa HHB-10118-sp]